LHITVPSGYQVLGSGLDTHQAAGDKVVYSFHFDHPSFPGSIAVVRDPGAKVSAEGVTTTLYFRGDEKAMAQQYGEQIGQMMTLISPAISACRPTRISPWWRRRTARPTAMPRPV
jgi:hypothetical protein